MFVELQDAMNAIWCVNSQKLDTVRHYFLSRLLSLALVVSVEILLLLCVAGAGVMAGISSHIPSTMISLMLMKNALIPCAGAFVLFTIVYKILPAVEVKWKHVWPGALIAAILFTIGRYGLRVYFQFHSPTSVFGAAGSLAAVLLWVYYSSFSLFFGAEFTRAWTSRYHRYRPRPKSVNPGHATRFISHRRERAVLAKAPRGIIRGRS
jgi:membrane protein